MTDKEPLQFLKVQCDGRYVSKCFHWFTISGNILNYDCICPKCGREFDADWPWEYLVNKFSRGGKE